MHVPEGYEPKHRGVMTSEDLEWLKVHAPVINSQRAYDARLKLKILSSTKRDYLCVMCSDTGEIVAYDAQGNVLGNVDCPECDGTGGGGFSGSQV